MKKLCVVNYIYGENIIKLYVFGQRKINRKRKAFLYWDAVKRIPVF